jgi:hypothetical protein
MWPGHAPKLPSRKALRPQGLGAVKSRRDPLHLRASRVPILGGEAATMRPVESGHCPHGSYWRPTYSANFIILAALRRPSSPLNKRCICARLISAQQLGQPCNAGSDPADLVLRHEIGGRAPAGLWKTGSAADNLGASAFGSSGRRPYVLRERDTHPASRTNSWDVLWPLSLLPSHRTWLHLQSPGGIERTPQIEGSS